MTPLDVPIAPSQPEYPRRFQGAEMPQITGSCVCGQLRYTAQAEPIFSAVCHCKTCQKQTGTAFRVVIAVPLAAVSIQGSSKTYIRAGDSRQQVVNRFCPDCRLNGRDRASGATRYSDHSSRNIGRHLLAEVGDGDLLR